ncbi:hypothetical protein ACU6PJ_004833, partial [Escherichia coli]
MGSCAAPSAKGDDKFITTDYLQQCRSSYIANLLFFNSEYNLYNRLKSMGLSYSRLLDDITISSDKDLSSE